MTVLEQVKDIQVKDQAKQTEKPSRLSAIVEAAYILEAVRK
jgi:hypothetical protein